MSQQQEVGRRLGSGNEAVALAALAAGVKLGTGYPGTPSTEILETFAALGGPAQWAPNEKVALEVGIGAAFAGARALVTMKQVGLNVAADPLFTTKPARTGPELMRLTLGIPVDTCPHCGGRMKLRALVRDRESIERFLRHQNLWTEPLGLAEARPPPYFRSVTRLRPSSQAELFE